MQHKRFIFYWLLTGCFLIAVMVVIGGITRLTHSGLSMVEWHMIVGSLPPITEAQWLEPFQKYQQSPEYQLKNSHFTLEEFKSIYWWEYIHRFLGRTIGLVFLLPFVFMWMRGWLTAEWKKKLIGLLLLGAFQGVLGWYMVKSGLVKNPYVSHYRLAAHLISAFAAFGYTLWLALQIMYSGQKEPGRSLPKLLPVGFLALLVVQIIYGAFVAGLRAGYAYNTFPKMGNSWVPDDVFALQPLWQNFLEGGAGVQFVHRCLAYLVAAMAIFMAIKAQKTGLAASIHTSVKWVSGLVALQFSLGVATLLLAVPVWLGVLHQFGALLLFAGSLVLIFQNRRVRKEERVLEAA